MPTAHFYSLSPQQTICDLVDEIRRLYRIKNPVGFGTDYVQEVRHIVERLNNLLVPKVALGELDEYDRFHLDILPRIIWASREFGSRHFIRYGDFWYFTTAEQAIIFKLSCGLE